MSMQNALADLDAGMLAVSKALAALRAASAHGSSLTNIYALLVERVKLMEMSYAQLQALTNTIGIERAAQWTSSPRYYVYISERYGKEIAPCLDALGECSGNAWHNLRFAASHWQRMEQSSGRSRSAIRYAIMAYDVASGQLRKVEQAEIDAALEKPDAR